jgi:hypothetical protein
MLSWLILRYFRGRDRIGLLCLIILSSKIENFYIGVRIIKNFILDKN